MRLRRQLLSILRIMTGAIITLIIAVEAVQYKSSHTALLSALAGVVAGSAIALATIYLIEIYRRTRYYDLGVALTGRPGAGKTVFANIIFDRLMSEVSPSFTADSATAIAVYQAIRGIDEGKWPTSTLDSVVFKYSGRIRFDTASFSRASIMNLEIGDSAGRHWIDLAQPRGETTGEGAGSSYLEYVLSANGVVHVISSEELLGESLLSGLRRDIQDLRIATNLMRSTGKVSGRVRLLLVLSKADLLPLDQEADSVREFVSASVGSATLFDFETLIGVPALVESHFWDGLQDVCEMASQLTGTFRDVKIMFSSVFDRTVPGGGMFVARNSSELLDWLFETARTASRVEKG